MDECIILSVKTSNNQEIIENMEFFKFRALIKSLKKYIESENKSNNGENSENNIQEESNNMMNNAKNTMKSFKAPNVKLPKK